MSPLRRKNNGLEPEVFIGSLPHVEKEMALDGMCMPSVTNTCESTWIRPLVLQGLWLRSFTSLTIRTFAIKLEMPGIEPGKFCSKTETLPQSHSLYF